MAALPALAQEQTAEPSAERQNSASPYYYYLNGRKHRLWLRDDMVASLPQIPAALSESEYQRRVDPAQARHAASGRFGELVPQEVDTSVVRLYAVDDNLGEGLGEMFNSGVRSYSASRARQASGNDYHYSEVFSSQSNSIDYRALPGGVFVKFAADWSEARISGWLGDQGVESHLAEKILKNNVYLIQAPSGMESLALANRLFETGEVIYSEPNWWQPVSR